MSSATTEGFRIKGWHVLAAVVGFFGVVIAADAAFLVMAYKTFPGEVSTTPYEDGLAYNRAAEERRAQAALGWSATAETTLGGVTVQITDRNGEPVAGLPLQGRLRRPATEAGGITLKFAEAAPGRYVADARPGSGAWDLLVSAPKAPFKAERRLTWP